jgi:hypothetical protein
LATPLVEKGKAVPRNSGHRRVRGVVSHLAWVRREEERLLTVGIDVAVRCEGLNWGVASVGRARWGDEPLRVRLSGMPMRRQVLAMAIIVLSVPKGPIGGSKISKCFSNIWMWLGITGSMSECDRSLGSELNKTVQSVKKETR